MGTSVHIIACMRWGIDSSFRSSGRTLLLCLFSRKSCAPCLPICFFQFSARHSQFSFFVFVSVIRFTFSFLSRSTRFRFRFSFARQLLLSRLASAWLSPPFTHFHILCRMYSEHPLPPHKRQLSPSLLTFILFLPGAHKYSNFRHNPFVLPPPGTSRPPFCAPLCCVVRAQLIE